MSIVATDILADLCGLSLGLLIAFVPVGLLLWLFGWRSHRFWIVLATTVMAGIFGLLEATTWRAEPIVVAVLLAIAAGVLALALVRVITFAVGGMAGAHIVGLIFPTLNQPIICFLVSGLVCLLLFRWYFMALTSLLGSTLLAYGTLALLHFHQMFDAIVWSEQNATPLNILCGVATFIGFAFQFLFERRRRRIDAEEGEGVSVLGRIGFGRKSRRAA